MIKLRKFIGLFLLSMLLTLTSRLCANEVVKIVKASPELLAKGSDEYIMIFENFKKNQDFIISYTRVIQKDPGSYKPLDNLRIDEENILHINGTDKAQFYSIKYPGFAPGEAIKYKISQPDGKIIAETTFTPKPIRKKSSKGTFYVQAELLTIYPTMYGITYEGFEMDEKIHHCMILESELEESDFVYSPANEHVFVLKGKGVLGGIAHIEITRSTGDKVILSLKWDKAIIKSQLKELGF